ncbi:hypothetical protein T4D_5572 [Trichinella pseudospiralis]|uniref:Uncharacterized protein n=1 Tax=Trichinella pseudospiralis TaxID=6337 RepID=A0A0V1FY51_TRIPS|nr:hypothetical protein T4D_5572 [Trichinella pseudospiralis]
MVSLIPVYGFKDVYNANYQSDYQIAEVAKANHILKPFFNDLPNQHHLSTIFVTYFDDNKNLLSFLRLNKLKEGNLFGIVNKRFLFCIIDLN